VHADKEPEPLNLGVPVVNFPRANAILACAQALLWVRDWTVYGKKICDGTGWKILRGAWNLRGRREGLIPRALFLSEMRIISPVSFELRLLE
jgi:hypothetical protein